MVAINDEHEHGDGVVCPGCRFKAALEEYLEFAAGDEESWHEFTSDLMVVATDSIAALVALRAARCDGDASEGDAAHAAAAVSRLGGVIDDLYRVVMDEDESPDAAQ